MALLLLGTAYVVYWMMTYDSRNPSNHPPDLTNGEAETISDRQQDH